jgi:hypothetical protein
MAQIPTNRRYEQHQRRFGEEASPQRPEAAPVIPLPYYPPPRPDSPLSWVGGIVGIAIGGTGGTVIGATLGAAGAVFLFLGLSITVALGALMSLLGVLSLTLERGDDSAENLGGVGCMSLLGGSLLLFGFAWVGERMSSLPIPGVDPLTVTLARWLNVTHEGSVFRALRAMIMIIGLVGLVGGGLWGAYKGFHLGYRWPGLALLTLAVIAPLALGAILYGVLNSHWVPAIPFGEDSALGDSVSRSPTLSPTPEAVWVAQVRARVRAGPGTTYPILRVLRPGELVTEQARVQKGEEEWLHVQLPDGTTGWVRSDLLQPP